MVRSVGEPAGWPQLHDALTRLGPLRQELDATEHDLIAQARSMGMSWAAIAQALGLTTRQAAEQRFLRLSSLNRRDPAPARERRRQQSVDMDELAMLRRSVVSVLRQLETDLDWDRRHPRAGLLRASLSAAATAHASGLYGLAEHAMADLMAMDSAIKGGLPANLAAALDRFRSAFAAATP